MPEPGVNAASPEVLKAIEKVFHDALCEADTAYLAAVARAARVRDAALHKAIGIRCEDLTRADAKARANAADG